MGEQRPGHHPLEVQSPSCEERPRLAGERERVAAHRDQLRRRIREQGGEQRVVEPATGRVDDHDLGARHRRGMKEGIHPRYEKATIHCACGNVVETRSTKENIHVDICSACHPFFTGKLRLVDTAGRVERFNRKYGKKSVDATPGAA